MQLHNLQRNTPNKREKRVGRGGKRGKTSGRGTKGQNARAGHKKRPEIREQLKKLPKLRGRGTHGLKSIESRALPVNVAMLEKVFSAGDMVTPQFLIERTVVRVNRGARPAIKILGDGELTKKLTISGCRVSATARKKIEAAGGSISA